MHLKVLIETNPRSALIKKCRFQGRNSLIQYEKKQTHYLKANDNKDFILIGNISNCSS